MPDRSQMFKTDVEFFALKVAQMSEVEVKAMINVMYLQMMELDNIYRLQLQEKWGIATPKDSTMDT